MQGPLRRATRRTAVVVAVVGAAVVFVPGVAWADSSVALAGGTLTVVGDGADNQYSLTFTSSAGTVEQVVVHDADGDVTSPGGPCAQTLSSTVTCTADATHPIDRVTVIGGPGNDELAPTGAPAGFVMSFSGDAGNDRFDVGPEKDTFDGGGDSDQANYDQMSGPVNVSADGVANDGAAGETDNIGSDVEEIDGTSAADTLTATSSVPGCSVACTALFGNGGNDTLNGGSGGDLLVGQGGDDTIGGGAGDDAVFGDEDFNTGETPSDGNDHLDGGAGSDLVAGLGGNDVMAGGDGVDEMDPGSGNDTVAAGPGDDFLDPGPGADDLHGGDGFDEMDYFGEPAGVSVSLNDVANDGASGLDGSATAGAGPAGDNVHSDVEQLDGTANDDTLTGDGASNLIFGDFGNDTVDGGGGADFLFGDDGNDTILSRDDAVDLVACGDGTDTATTDDIDSASACETNNVAPAHGTHDTSPAKVTVGSLKSSDKRASFLKQGISFTLTASEAVTYDVELAGTLRGAHVARVGDLVLAAKELRSSGAKTTVKLKPNSRMKAAIGKKAKLRLTVIALDAAGNRTTITKRIKVT